MEKAQIEEKEILRLTDTRRSREGKGINIL